MSTEQTELNPELVAKAQDAAHKIAFEYGHISQHIGELITPGQPLADLMTRLLALEPTNPKASPPNDFAPVHGDHHFPQERCAAYQAVEKRCPQAKGNILHFLSALERRLVGLVRQFRLNESRNMTDSPVAEATAA